MSLMLLPAMTPSGISLQICRSPQRIFRKASTFVRTKFDGAWRPIALRTVVDASVDETTVRLKFTLPPGHYATTVCREVHEGRPAPYGVNRFFWDLERTLFFASNKTQNDLKTAPASRKIYDECRRP